MIIAFPMSPKKQLQILRSQWTFHITQRVLPTSGLFPSAFRQGGFNSVGRRTDVTIAFPIAFARVLSIAGLPVVNDSNPSGRGLENIKTYSTSSFVYYSGYDINNKNLFWLAFGV